MAMSRQDKNTIITKALAHPIRRQILHAMEGETNGGLSPASLSQALGIPLGTVSYHVRLLSEPGILKLVRTVPRRGAVEHFYTRSGNHIDRKVAELLKHIGKD